MSWKQSFTVGIISALLSSIACIIYAKIYSEAFYVNFWALVGFGNMSAASAIGTLLMAIGYKLAIQWKGIKTVGWLNILYCVISFASIAGVLGFNLPLEIESPEMFPGLVIPMHFFPLLSFLVILPFFDLTKKQ